MNNDERTNPTASDLTELLRRIRMDATAIQAKVSDALTQLASLELPAANETRCELCGIRLRGPLSLAEHVYYSHGGTVPAHFLTIERAAGFAAEDASQAPPLPDRRSVPYDAPQPPAPADTPTTGAAHASSAARASVSVSDGGNAPATSSTPATPAAP